MLITKALGLVETKDAEDAPHGAFEVVLSAATLDRDGEIVDSKAFDPLPDHIPFDVDHGMTVASTVGSGKPFYAEDGSLHVSGTFASTQLAQEVRALVAEGHIRTTSVAFMAADRTEADAKGVVHVTAAELLNGTFTPVPSNRESVVLSAKAVGAALDEKVGARNSAKDAEHIQAAHDAMVGLGAACAGKSHTGGYAPTDVEPVADVESKSADETDAAAAEAAAASAPSTDEADTMKAMAKLVEDAARFAF